MLKHTILNIITSVFFFLVVISASTSPPVTNDPYTGHYYLHGSKIVSLGGWFGSEYTVIDTTYFSSVVVVKKMKEKADTLHFFGLPGADEREIKIYNGNGPRADGAPFLPAYDISVLDRVYGSYSGTVFEIDYNLVSNFYKATGTINNGKIEIQGLYTDRGISVEYDLVGEKIEIIK